MTKTLLCYSNLDGFAVQLKNHTEAALTALDVTWQECHISGLAEAHPAFQPTMTLFFHPNVEFRRYAPVVAQLPGHKCLWSMEGPWETDLMLEVYRYCFYALTHEPTEAEALRRADPGKKVLVVPHACNPVVHRPQAVGYEYRSDVLLVGNAYPSRLRYFREHADELRDKMVTIIGVGYRGLAGYEHQRLIHGHISEPEMVKYINGAKLVLNLHRQADDLPMASSRRLAATAYNNRFYEVAACGVEQQVIGRGDTFVQAGASDEFHREHSYASRLAQYYLPLLE